MSSKYANLPIPQKCIDFNVIEQSCIDLEKELKNLNYKQLGLSAYGEKYYAYDISKLTYMLQSYAFMLAWILEKTQKRIQELKVIDHGGGVGIFSLLAKKAGAAIVLHQDINPIVSGDAAKISKALNIPIDYFFSEDTDQLHSYCKKNNISFDALGSRNVIEHVYDLDSFFRNMNIISEGKFVLFMSTTANMKNPLINLYNRRIQRIYEYEGVAEWGSYKRDKSKSGLELRKKIIKEFAPELKETEIEALAKNSRGLIKKDIEKAINTYKTKGSLPPLLSHPTNTCDPYSGSWAEHLLPLSDYKNLIEKNGFSFSYLNGFYNTHYPQWYLNLISPILNIKIKLLGKNGTFLAPFISIIGIKK